MMPIFFGRLSDQIAGVEIKLWIHIDVDADAEINIHF